MKFEFSEHFFKLQTSKFIKMRVVGAELYFADGQMDGYGEANSCFSMFCERA
jgi:hypothetical protein